MSGNAHRNVARHPAVTPAPTRRTWKNDIARRQGISIPEVTPPTSASSDIGTSQPPSSDLPSSDPSSLDPSSSPSSLPPSSEPPSSSPFSSPTSQESSTPPSSVPPSSEPPSSSPSSIPTSTSSSTPDSSSSTEQPPSSQSSSSSAVIPGSTSSSAPPSTTPPPTSSSSSSSSFSAETTITTTFVTTIDGIEQTVTSAIPTTINRAPSTANPQKRAVIAGSVIGGIALVAIIVSLVLFCKRKNYRKLRVFGHHPRSRSMLLAGEDFDDSDPPMMQYRDYPTLTPSQRTSASRHRNTTTQHSIPLSASNTSNTSPLLMGMRASESGSIFHEDVWPPPGEQSRFVDPILATSSQVNLGRIVDDVMGANANANAPPSSYANPRPPSYHFRSGSNGSDPFRTPPLRHSPQPSDSSNGLLRGNAGDVDGLRSPLAVDVTPHNLFVTNPRSPSPTQSIGTPGTPGGRKNWLERAPHPRNSIIIGNESNVSMGEAI
ncbi:unnamed protein product [Somion occarium]|uniref:Uncharacterized protein n=1 Tax=Somion occarium TaxID=3059160 RepID=A0ABP1CTW7_9APHY